MKSSLIDIFKNVLIDIDISMNVFIDIDIDINIFKSDLIDIDIFKTCRYIDNRYGLSIYRTPLCSGVVTELWDFYTGHLQIRGTIS